MVLEKFNLTGKVCIITGGAGFLGKKHAEAILESDGIPVILDINENKINEAVDSLKKQYKKEVVGYNVDITKKSEILKVKNRILENFSRIDVLINNAANNPKIEEKENLKNWTHFENFPESIWNQDLNVGLKGAFFCSQVFGKVMAENKKGVILNISSDLGIIAPDQRIYLKNSLKDEEQFKKPVTYSVVKYALIGLTKYLATYWADKSIRVNAICPGGVFNNQDKDFVAKLTNLIPMGRMADPDEYKAAILFLVSDASSYMTGSTIIIDGGRTCW
ncbi:SDR family oxidoreductase [Candidatus Woesearchaeota archaeon]|nr:SDR family oxidoreductase [Candidatus Woesearchaeota archaeon]